MNYILHLNAFFKITRLDSRLTSSHLSLYIALFHYWNLNHFQNPFSFSRLEIMEQAKIGSKNTYYKCLKELHQIGYIKQQFQQAKYKPIKISLINLDEYSTEQNGQHLKPILSNTSIKNETGYSQKQPTESTKKDTSDVLKAVPLIKHTIKKNKEEKTIPLKSDNKKIEINNLNPIKHVSNKRHTDNNSPPMVFDNPAPTLSEVEAFFQLNNYPELEAKKFFYHYQSNGWLIAGKSPMKSWESSAHKWQLNKKEFKTIKKSPHDLTIGTNKNYSEPL